MELKEKFSDYLKETKPIKTKKNNGKKDLDQKQQSTYLYCLEGGANIDSFNKLLKNYNVRSIFDMTDPIKVQKLQKELQKDPKKYDYSSNRSGALSHYINFLNSLKNGEVEAKEYPSKKELPLNTILYGPPGTGKTFSTIGMALDILLVNAKPEAPKDQKLIFDKLKNKGRIVFTTFHQSMSYEDFIEGIKPETKDDGAVTYDVKKGIFRKICEEAKKTKESKRESISVDEKEYNINNYYVLIIDEINRGNVSEIFGELITLIEDSKRLGNKDSLTVKLPYSGEDFGVPNNVYIIGTMNTADRSVEALDTALRRRFNFMEMMPNYELKELDRVFFGYSLKDILKTINQRITWLKGREQQIGHSYFYDYNDKENLKSVFKNNIVPLLQEYFYGDYFQIGLVLGKNFVIKEKECTFANGFTNDSDREELYRLLTDEEWNNLNMEEAIKNLMNKPTNSVTPSEGD